MFFYAPTGGSDPGFYGWAVILDWYEETEELYFRPTAPSDLLKMHPWWDDEASALADEIRGKFKQGTFWFVRDEIASKLRKGIARWTAAYGRP